MRTNVPPAFTPTAPNHPSSTTSASVAAFNSTNTVKSGPSNKTAMNAAAFNGTNTVKNGPNIRTASNPKLPVHGNSLSEMTVLSSLMKSATAMSGSAGMKSSTPTNGGTGTGTIGGNVASMVRKEPTKRTVTNVRKAIEDAALYHGKDGFSTQDHSKNDHRADKGEKDDYEGDKVIKKDLKGLTDDDRRMVEELSAWGDHDNDDGDDF